MPGRHFARSVRICYWHIARHQCGFYGIPDRGRIAVGACADLLLFDPATVGISAPRRVNDLPAGGTHTLRDPIGVRGVFVNGVRVSMANTIRISTKARGRCSTGSCPPPRHRWQAPRSNSGRHGARLAGGCANPSAA